ncbi:MAG TPA: hypothetical protein VH572_12385 [Gaiella sp.]
MAALAAARRSGSATALAGAQQRASDSAASLASARTAAATAGKRVAGVVRAAGVQGRLTRAQSAATIDALLAELAKRGVPAAELRALVPAALAPKPTDVLATLGSY